MTAVLSLTGSAIAPLHCKFKAKSGPKKIKIHSCE